MDFYRFGMQVGLCKLAGEPSLAGLIPAVAGEKPSVQPDKSDTKKKQKKSKPPLSDDVYKRIQEEAERQRKDMLRLDLPELDAPPTPRGKPMAPKAKKLFESLLPYAMKIDQGPESLSFSKAITF